MSFSWRETVRYVGIAAASSMIAVWGVRTLEERPRKAERPAETETQRRDSGRDKPSTEVRVYREAADLSEVERRLEELERRRAEADGPEERVAMTPEERSERFRREVGKADEAFFEEVVDATWASGATEKLTGTIKQLGDKLGYKVEDLECRRNRCRSTLRWNDAQAAMKEGHTLAEMAIPGLNCAQTIWIDDSANANPVTTLHLDCSGLRAGTVQDL